MRNPFKVSLPEKEDVVLVRRPAPYGDWTSESLKCPVCGNIGKVTDFGYGTMMECTRGSLLQDRTRVCRVAYYWPTPAEEGVPA